MRLRNPIREENRRLAALIGGGAAAALLLAGCGGTVGYSQGNGDRSNGKQLFTQKCASCHVLADAGSTGQIGPNLDDAFYASRRDGLGQQTIQQVVRGQIAYPVVDPSAGTPGMPADIFTGQDAEDVASYVAAVAGLDTPKAPQAGPAPPPAATTPTGDPAAEPGAQGDASKGKSVFASAGCGSCHTLADAGATGTVGPNLDETQPDKQLAVDRVTNGKGAMPSFEGQLSPDEIGAVAEYVSSAPGP